MSVSSLTSSCQSALTSLLSSDFATCADVVSLVEVATASGSIVSSLESYLSGMCTTTPCTTAQLSNASSTVESGCSSDISSGSAIPVALDTIINHYGSVRSLLCLEHTSNSSYCIPEILSASENSTGTSVTISELESLLSGSSISSFISGIPTSVYCTDCGHALTTEAVDFLKNASYSQYVSTVQSDVSSRCGSSFVDGDLPSGISTAGANSTNASAASAAVRPAQLSKSTIFAAGSLALLVLSAGAVSF